jgi:ATP-dependent RNA helicase HelY
VPSGRRAGLAVVLDVGSVGLGEPRPMVLTEDRWAGRIAAGEFVAPV